MTPTNNLALGISVDNRQGVQSINQFNSELKKVEQVAVQSTRGAQGGFQSLQGSILRTVGLLSSGGGAAALAKWTIGVSAGFERAQVGLRALVGDVTKADKIFRQVQDQAEFSPFEFSTLIETARRIKAVGFEAEQIIPILKQVDAAGGALDWDIGKTADFVKALGDIKAAGKLTGEEMRQLKNASIPALEFLSEGFGKSAAEIQNAIKGGLVPAEAAITAILQGIEKRFGPAQEAVAKTASVAFSNFRDSVERAADDLVREYLPEITKATKDFTASIKDGARFLKENKDLLLGTAEAVVYLGGAFATYRIAIWIEGITAAIVGLNTALLANPFGVAAAMVAGAGVATYKNAKAAVEALAVRDRENQIRELAAAGKSVDEIARKLDLAQREVESVLFGGRKGKGKFEVPVELDVDLDSVSKLFKDFKPPEVTVKPKKELLKFSTGGESEKAAKELENLEKKGADILQAAREKLAAAEGGELARIYQDYDAKLNEVGKSARARADVGKALELEVQAFGVKSQREFDEAAADSHRERMKRQTDQFADYIQGTLRFGAETLQAEQELETARLDLRLAGVDRQKKAELDRLQIGGDQTVEQKVGIEARKLAIEEDYAKKALDVRLQLLDIQTARELEAIEARAMLEGISVEELGRRRLAIEEAARVRRTSLEEDVQADIEGARQDAVKKSNDVIFEAQKTQFDRVRDSWRGIFRSLTSETKNWGDTIKNILKASLLTPLEDAASSWAATLLTGFSPRGGASGARGGGLFGLGSLLGGGGFGPMLGSATAPGGTGTFTGAPIAGVGGSGGGVAGMGLLGLLGGFGRSGAAASKVVPIPGLTNASNSAAGSGGGIGGNAGAGMMLAGGLLAADGLRRGGLLGTLQTSAGGALIGAKFGGVPGALIGAGVGLGAGFIRGLFDTAEEKAKKEAKSVYGVNLDDRSVLRQIVDTARGQFGGNVPMAVRSQPIRELVELYAASSGQNFGGGLANVQRPLQLIQTGGSLYQLPQRIGGNSYVYPGSIGAAPGSGMNIYATFTLDGQTTRDVIDGQTVQTIATEGGLVANAAAGAYRGGLAPSSSRVSTFEPLTVPGA